MNPQSSPRLLDQIRQHCAASGYSPRTAQAYTHWVACFVRASGLQHPRELGKAQAVAWLATLAQPGGSRASQAQARAALVFLYRRVLGLPALWLNEIPAPRVQTPEVLPLDAGQAQALLARCGGAEGLAGALMAGCGLRLAECCALELAAVDLRARRLHVRGKGGGVRVVPVPVSLVAPLRAYMAERQAENAADEARGWQPCAALFSGPTMRRNAGGKLARQGMARRGLQQAISQAAQAVGVEAHCHTLRHTFATRLVVAGVDLPSVQRVMGHADIRSTVRYVHVQAAERVARVDPLA